MFKIDSGGPAFPRTGFIPDTKDAVGERLRDLLNTITEAQPGMSLFDYYVGQALAGLLANPGTFGRAMPPLERAEAQEMVQLLGGSAVVYARAVMEAREAYLNLPRKPRTHNPEEDS